MINDDMTSNMDDRIQENTTVRKYLKKIAIGLALLAPKRRF
jgi:hypothetical protein